MKMLLLGGTHHGQVICIKMGVKVQMIDGSHYWGRNELHNGRLYRIGLEDSLWRSKARLPDDTWNLIESTGLKPIA